MRIYELAKKLKVTSEELMKALAGKGFAVKSHMSSASSEIVSAAEKLFAPAKAAGKKAARTGKGAPKGAKAPPPKGKAVKAPPAKKAAVSKKAEPTGTTEKPRKGRRRDGGPSAGERVPAGRKPAVKRPVAKHRARVATTAEKQQKAVRESVRRTLAKLEATRKSRRRKDKSKAEKAVTAELVKVTPGMSPRELAAALGVEPSELISKCMELGIGVTMNDRLDREVIELIAEELDVEVEFKSDLEEPVLKAKEALDAFEFEPRAPVVTVMGHVDHGKTSILDYIRKSSVAAHEAGGITQHIGAYEIEAPHGKITFIDTPGHEAFTSMRARGAKVTDIVVLVVAADDGVMPQTVEAISHARAAGVPIVVAVNKIDLPNANPARVKQQLADRDILVEEFGGDVVCQEVSAKTGEGIDKLLELITLQAELLELKARRDGPASGVVIEVKKEEGRGILCTILVKQGRLKVGDAFIAGAEYGRVRALLDHTGKNIREAGPSMPVQVLGLNGLPSAGDEFQVVDSEKAAREISSKRLEARREVEIGPARKQTLEDLYRRIQEGEVKELKLIVRGDTNGSVEALVQSLSRLSTDEVKVEIIHSGVGFVTESDVLLASSSDAVIVGFNVKVSPKAEELASKERVQIRRYDIIYECLEEIGDAIEGMLEPEMMERVTGRAEVRRVFKIPRTGFIAGSMVLEGSIVRNATARLVRNGEVVHEGTVSSLKRFQEDVREVQKDFECGIGISGLTDLREGDIIETYVVEEKSKPTT